MDSIFDIDRESVISVCAAGRASVFLVTLAVLMGLHARVGMEDTVWRYPHKDDLVASNLETFQTIAGITELLGRPVMSGARFKSLLGIAE